MRHRSLLQTRLDTALGRSGSVWGPCQKPFWTIPRRSGHPGRPKVTPGTAPGRPGPVTSAGWSVFKTAWSGQNCPRSNFCSFSVQIGRSLVHLHAAFMRSIVLLITPSFARSTLKFQSHDPSVEWSFTFRTYKPHLVIQIISMGIMSGFVCLTRVPYVVAL